MNRRLITLSATFESYQDNDEPAHDKTNRMTVRPAKTQISLIRVFALHSMGS